MMSLEKTEVISQKKLGVMFYQKKSDERGLEDPNHRQTQVKQIGGMNE